jgi:two-component system sensor histidine kinase/response regulator
MPLSSPSFPVRSSAGKNRRILVIDDNRAIHGDFRKILCPPVRSDAENSLDALANELLGNADESGSRPPSVADFMVESAYQGREGCDLVREAELAARPYAMAFVDVRMPPGWDGIETTLELWKIAPDLQVVICTAYSDYSWDEMLTKLSGSDRLLILKKPFDSVEVLQLASSLTEKWHLLQSARLHAVELEERVRLRTRELQSANATLEREIARRAQVESDLVSAKEAAEAADRAKSVFLANMSHEIRTPMNGVIGMADVLLAGRLTTEQRDLAETLANSGQQLVAIINDILDFSKIEAGHLELEKIDFRLGDQLGQVLDLQSHAAHAKGLELVLDIAHSVPVGVCGDPVRLHQVLLNIVGNAIKFTEQGEVAIAVTGTPDDDGQVLLRFEITDTGIGIPPDVQHTLFQPFVQADSSTTRRFGGTGLGLAICKRLVDLMQGEIGVRSTAGVGSTFWFTAKLGEAVIIDPPRRVPSAKLENFRALVVDDNATNRKLLDHLLTAWRMAHTLVPSGQLALDELRAAIVMGKPYDLVILDYLMPEMDGLMLASAIKEDPALAGLVIVMLTSRGERLPPAMLSVHGLAACELKPVRAEKLQETLLRALSPAEEKPLTPTPFEPRPVDRDQPILVAEDNLVNQKVAFMLLRQLGYSADIVNNGREALEAIRKKTYAVVLMDAQMPIMDGFEATREIRLAQQLGDPSVPPNLRIIAMTANAMAGDREACLAAGMDDYLAKPVKPAALRAVLARYIAPELTASSQNW